MALSAGTRLGSYEILSILGAGGMGEVYRARDTKLGRSVAVKVLPEAVASDPDRVARFEREAQLLASLNHPHIAALYGMEESGGRHLLIMELVEGVTLAELLSGAALDAAAPNAGEAWQAATALSPERRGWGPGAVREVGPRGRPRNAGPLPVDQALSIAQQIAEALEAAHEKGIVHRDLKPANVKITPDGMVKVLDFGLAKALEAAPAATSLSHSPTLSVMATHAGVILGTAAYMSPEQARGEQLDRRSDIFSFGCLLYEMLTGRQAFQGKTVSDLLASVLAREPDLTLLPSRLNPRIRQVLRRALEKETRRRWQAVGDIRVELESIQADPRGALVEAERARPQPLWRRSLPVVAAAIVVGTLSSAVTLYFRPSTPLTTTRFSFTLAEDQQFTNDGRQVVAISPDGTQMVYVGNWRLYHRSMSDLNAVPIPGTEIPQGVLNPVFSPDGRSIAFWSAADQTIKRIAINGGAAVTICPAERPFGMTWDTDGIIFGEGSAGIMRVPASGGKPEILVKVNDGEIADGPQMLPDGRTVLFTLATGTGTDRWDRAQVVVQSLRSGERKTLIQGGSDGRYLPTGHVVYALGGTLFAVPFDLRRLEVTGGAVPIVEGVRRGNTPGVNTGVAHFSVSNTGSLIYVPGPVSATAAQRDLALLDRKGSVQPLKLPPGSYEFPRISPDGRRVAFGTDDGKEAIVWIYDLAGTSSMRRLTFGGRNRFPIWSADSQRVAFQSDREGDLAIFWQRADGTGTAERLIRPEQGTSYFPESWAPNGERLLFSALKSSGISLWAFSLQEKKAEAFGGVQSSDLIRAMFSRDGRWVAYGSFETGRSTVYVQPFPATGAKYQISKDTGYSPLWSPDGKEIFFRAPLLTVLSVTTQPTFTFGSPVPVPVGRLQFPPGVLLPRQFDITPDGRIIGVVDSEQTPSGAPTTPQIQVVLNWFEELKQRVPVP